MSDQGSNAPAILAALGGADNVVELEPCITRLRVRVVDPGRVDGAALGSVGALGVRQTGHELQLVFGPQADEIAQAVSALLPAAVSQPGGLAPMPADADSRAASLLLGTNDDDEEATGE